MISLDAAKRSQGFSLVEVMVALVVTGIGLLGLAKMESVALVSTTVAGNRSIAALQAASMAAAMHADRDYWGKGLAPPLTTVDATPTNNWSAAAANTCSTAGAAACQVNDVARWDLYQWGISMAQVLPGYVGTISCTTGGLPVTCTIKITWVENAAAADDTQTGLANLTTPTYTLYVEP